MVKNRDWKIYSDVEHCRYRDNWNYFFGVYFCYSKNCQVENICVFDKSNDFLIHCEENKRTSETHFYYVNSGTEIDDFKKLPNYERLYQRLIEAHIQGFP